MNPQSPEHGQNPEQAEQAIREQLLADVVRDSIGTVGLYVSADFAPEESSRMVATQAERHAINPASQPNSMGSSGWGNYGERDIAKYAQTNGAELGEAVSFVPTEEGTVDVRYAFSQPGYTDGTGRPGNALTVGFIVSEDTARTLRNALRADPSLIQSVIERQVQAIGVDTAGDNWKNKLKPHYEDRFKITVADDDRELTIRDVDSTGAVVNEETGRYGDRRPLSETMAAQTPESVTDSPEAPVAGVYEQTEQDVVDVAWDDQVRKSEAVERTAIAEARAAGKSLEQVIAELEASRNETNQMMEEPGLSEEASDNLYLTLLGETTVLAELKAEAAKSQAVATARENIDAAHEAVGAQNTALLDGEQVTVVARYNLENADKTPYVTVRDANGTEKHVKASMLGQ